MVRGDSRDWIFVDIDNSHYAVLIPINFMPQNPLRWESKKKKILKVMMINVLTKINSIITGYR